MFEILTGVLESQKDLNFKDEDLEFILSTKKGDIKAFEVLVKKYQKDIVNFAYRILENFEDACDVAQEAFFISYKKIKTFKNQAKFSTWLYKITLNLARNHLKKKKKEKNLEDLKGKSFYSIELNPSESIEKEELKKKIKKCLSLLKNEFKEIIILRDLEGLTYEEISYLLKIPEGTVKSRLARARESFIENFERLGKK